jgi:dihydroflavonol-4-reductase
MKKVLIIGGKGFIGYHLIYALKQKGYEIGVATRKSSLDSEYCECPLIHFDLATFGDDEIKNVLKSYPIIVFAGGADDRTMPSESAAEFFYKENVLPCVRIAELGKNCGTEKLIILGSYFTYFNRERPEWKMAEHHPYVRSRVLQQQETLKAAGDQIKVKILELPYIFGASPDKVPLWKPLVKYIHIMPVVFYTRGGTAMIGVEEVARAIVGAIEYKGTESIWQVSAENLTWKEMIGLFSSAMGKKRPVIIVPTPIVRFFSWVTRLYFKIAGKQSGLDIYHFIKTQTSNTYMDASVSMEKLCYEKGDLTNSIRETVQASGVRVANETV